MAKGKHDQKKQSRNESLCESSQCVKRTTFSLIRCLTLRSLFTFSSFIGSKDIPILISRDLLYLFPREAVLYFTLSCIAGLLIFCSCVLGDYLSKSLSKTPRHRFYTLKVGLSIVALSGYQKSQYPK